MAEYTTRAKVSTRLTNAGVKWICDRNRSGTITEQEYVDNIDTPIEWAGRRIDSAICEQVSPEYARGLACTTLDDLCVDLASFRSAGQGGREIAETSPLREAYTAAMGELDRYSQGRRIPNFQYPVPVNAHGSPEPTRMPKSHNPPSSRQRRGRR